MQGQAHIIENQTSDSFSFLLQFLDTGIFKTTHGILIHGWVNTHDWRVESDFHKSEILLIIQFY